VKMPGIVHFWLLGAFRGLTPGCLGWGLVGFVDMGVMAQGFGREIGESHIWRGVVRRSRRAFGPRSDVGCGAPLLVAGEEISCGPPTRVATMAPKAEAHISKARCRAPVLMRNARPGPPARPQMWGAPLVAAG